MTSENVLDYEVIHNEHNSLSIIVKNTSHVIINALRRSIMVDIPMMAISQVYIEINNTILTDEVIAHQLGLLHLNVLGKDFTPLSENDKYYDEHNSLEFRLDVGYNAFNPIIYVKDIEWIPHGDQIKKYGNISFVSQNHPLFRLIEGQRITLVAYATRGTGKMHSKYIPTSACYFRNVYNVKIHSAITGTTANKIKEECPNNVFDIEDFVSIRPKTEDFVSIRPKTESNNSVLKVNNENECNKCGNCTKISKKITINQSDSYIFSFESETVNCETLLREGLRILEKKMALLRQLERILFA